MFYSVKYRYPGQWFWKHLKRVKGDGIVEGNTQSRFFILDDEVRVELPTVCEFVFCQKRFETIKRNMETQAGVSIPTVQ